MPKGFQVVSRGSGDLKTRYRPQTLEELIPTTSIKRLKSFCDNPDASRVYLFEGITGCGKTTAARIIARASVCTSTTTKPCLECSACQEMEDTPDFLEINAANFRKIDDIRSMVESMRYTPMRLSKKIYILDEVHQLTDQSQQLLLKELEEPSEDKLIFMCTTDLKGLRKTLVDRATTVNFKSVTTQQANNLIDQVLLNEQVNIPNDLREAAIEKSGGSVRALLNNIQLIIEGGKDFNSFEDQIPPEVPALSKALMNRDWNSARDILKNVKKEKAESLRIQTESYLRAVLLKLPQSGIQKAAYPLGYLAGSLYDEPQVCQYNQLVLRCARICYGSKK